MIIGAGLQQVERMNVERLVGSGIATGGGPPAAELISLTHQLGARIRLASQVTLVLLSLAVLAMATARYW
jgi:hypothetical protein